MAKTKSDINTRKVELDEQLLSHDFDFRDECNLKYTNAKIVAEHYAMSENAIAVLSNMPGNKSYICYGQLGNRLGIGTTSEEVDSIWEKKIIERIHPDDVAEKIAFELQFHSFVKQQPDDKRTCYYLQHFPRIKSKDGFLLRLRHRIYYLLYDNRGNVMLTLCLYTAAQPSQCHVGIINSLDDTLAVAQESCLKGLLSKRECKILEMISQGEASKQISESLCISINTVNNHRQNILRKLLCKNTAQAVSVAKRLGLLSSE